MNELQKGDRIPGSKYYRSFCDYCGEPMRVVRVVSAGMLPIAPCCEKCEPRNKTGTAAPKEDVGPSQENAIRIMEGD